jgi:hypothetical protein
MNKQTRARKCETCKAVLTDEEVRQDQAECFECQYGQTRQSGTLKTGYTPERVVVANDASGFWEVHEDGALLAEFESESLAYEFAAAPTMLRACKKDVERIEHLCGMVNDLAAKLGIGKKVNAEDWTDMALEAIALAEDRADAEE